MRARVGGVAVLLLFAAASCERRGPPVRAIALGLGHGCALLEDATVRCWGFNQLGQVGSGDTADRTVPTLVPGLAHVTQLAAIGSSSCALLADGTARCWGWNLEGQLGGEPSSAARPVPAAVPALENAAGIALGGGHGCAWHKDGSASCWGRNSSGQLGDGSGTARMQATPVVDVGDAPLLTGVTSMALGQAHTCALMKDETVRCWGLDSSGQVGGGALDRWRFAPAVVAGLRGVKAIAAGNYTSCALLGDGSVRCWGAGLFQGGMTAAPTAVEDLPVATQIAVGPAHACARTADESLRCWGADNAPKHRVTGVNAVAVGLIFGCMTTADSALKCWGTNDHGQLGDGTTESRPDPVSVRW